MTHPIFKILALGMAALAWPVAAQDFPSKPITMVMPYAPGGPGDTITRVFAGAMQRPWANRSWWTTPQSPTAHREAETAKAHRG